MARKPKIAEATRPPSEERGELALILDAAVMVLRPSHEAIESFELATGKGLIELANGSISGKLRLGEVAQIATECIRAWGRATGSKSYQASMPRALPS